MFYSIYFYIIEMQSELHRAILVEVKKLLILDIYL